jgi:LysR family transcriptional activator of nhaA
MNAQPPGRINLKHLHYFHEVAREGSLTGAARRLHLAPQTLSSQVRDYAESIFALGTELRRVMAGRAKPRRLALRAGVTDSVPKLLTAHVHALLEEIEATE